MIKNTARNQDDLSRILDSCLELITNGSATVEMVLDQYPEYSGQLKPPLEAALWLQSRKEVFNPRPGFVKLSHRRLVNRFKGQGAEADTAETFSRIPAFFQERRIAVQYSALLTLTAVLLFVGYRSTDFLVQRSIPGDPLYKTKRVQEELHVFMSTNHSQRTRLRIKFAHRRVIEMQELVMVGRDELLDETLENFEFQMAEAAEGIMIVAETDQNDALVLATLLTETLTGPVNSLVGVLDTKPEFASADIIDSINTLTAQFFDQSPYDSFLVLNTSIPGSTFTVTFTPTTEFTATAYATTTTEANNTLPSPIPTTTAVSINALTATPTPQPTHPSASSPDSTNTPVEPTSTPLPTIQPTNTPLPTVAPSNTPQPTVAPSNTPQPTVQPTNTPQPTVQPTNTPQPTATDEPPATPTPEQTKKPKPTLHPTFWPTKEN